MIVLAWALLISVPVLMGWGMMSIIYRKNRETTIGFADCVTCGFLGCIGISQVMHTIGLLGGLSLKATSTMFLASFIVILLVMILISLFGIYKNREQYKCGKQYATKSKSLPIMVLIVFLLQSLFIYGRSPIYITGDITIETVQSFLASNGIYSVMPLTGMENNGAMPFRYTILCLPTLYAVLADGLGLEAVLVICHMFPIVVLGVTYLAYFRLSETLFGREKAEERYCFLLVVGILLSLSEQVPFLDGFGALHGGYLGTSIRNLILLPCVVTAMLERRYWKAVLCILAEACIVWTFYGCGICLLISLGIFILDLLEKKVPGLRSVLQIFQKKEEQA